MDQLYDKMMQLIDVNRRIQGECYNWRKFTAVLWDKKVPHNVKRKFYCIAIRSVVLYGSEYWAVNGQHEHKIGVDEMRILR